MSENDAGEEERARGAGGEYVEERTPEEVFAAMEIGEPYSAGSLADEMGWPRRTVQTKLSRLAEDDRITKKKLHARRVIWIRTEE